MLDSESSFRSPYCEPHQAQPLSLPNWSFVQVIVCWPVTNLIGVRATLISNQRWWRLGGAERFVVPHHEEAPLSHSRPLIDQINVDLTPIKSSLWEQNPIFKENLKGNPVKIIELAEMMQFIQPRLSTTVAGTEVGRTLQLFKAAGILNDLVPNKTWTQKDIPTL